MRLLASLCVALLLFTVVVDAQRHRRFAPVTARGTSKFRSSAAFFNVMDYGANGNGQADNTAAFQAALNAASAAGGADVFAPAGVYMFTGSLNVPQGVQLLGTYDSVPSHDLRGGQQPNDGTVFTPTGGRGNANATAFITLNLDSTLAGVVIFYPQQESVQLPVPYPWTISMIAANSAVLDVELLNPWNGISAVQAHRHYIARVQGQPINIGVFVDETYDIGRIEDVHFNPWFSNNQPFLEWQMQNGRAFVLGRSDWEYVFNTFAFGYAIGYHFIETSTGSMNGNFLGIGADLAINASVQVDASQPAGILITNGEFTSFIDKNFAPKATADSTQVVVGPDNSGPVKFTTSSFWGPSDSVARLYGSGTTSFVSCTLVQWDLKYKNGTAALRAWNGNLIVQGTEFQQNGTQVELFPGVSKAVIVGNVMAGKYRLLDHGAKHVESGYNADDGGL